mgnify:CR=1 FL=1
MVRTELGNLSLVQTSEGEHADLIGNVVPGAWRAKLLNLGAQSLAHADDAARHGRQVLFPLGKELGVVENSGSDASAVDGRVGDFGTLEDGQLRGNTANGALSVGTRASHDVEATSTFTIKAEVLGETLSNNKLETLLDKVANSSSITGEVAGCETLVGAVKEGEVLLLADNRGNLLPLVQRRINTSRVVSTCVQQNNGALRSGLDGALHAIEVKATCLLVEVRVLSGGNADIGEDLVVVGPCRVGEVDSLVSLVELGEEQSSQMDSTGPGDGLHGSRTTFFQSRRIGAEHQLSSLGGKLGKTCDRSILVVEFGVVSENFVGLEGTTISINSRSIDQSDVIGKGNSSLHSL